MNSLTISYDLWLVGLSYVISVFGAYTALQLAIGIPSAQGRSVLAWVLGAALAIGGGAIWSMHFIGMLAYQVNIPVSYDPTITAISAVIAVAVTGIGLYIVGRGEPSIAKLLMGGTFTGLGVAGMHYTGMAAMIMPAELSYDTTIFALSMVIAVVAATAALWLAFHLRGNLQRFGSAFVMGAAVCGMHYTGMAAVILTPTGQGSVDSAGGISPQILGISVFGVAGVLLTVMLLVAMWRSQEFMGLEE